MAEHATRVTGLWWLPGAPHTKVPGILTYSPMDGAELELIGLLRDPFVSDQPGSQRVTRESLREMGEYGRVCGVAGGTSFTLEGCFRVHLSNLLAQGAGATSERIHVDHLIRGAEFEAGEPVDATAVEARLLHLPYWIGEGGIEERHVATENVAAQEAHVTLEARRLRDRTIDLHNGMSLTLGERFNVFGDGVTERGLRRDFTVRIAGIRNDIDEYLAVATAFQHLVSLGVGRSSTFEELAFRHPDISRHIGFHTQWLNWETRDVRPPKTHDVLFDIEEFGGDDAIHRWCAFAETHRGVVSRVMATRIRAGGYVSDRLLNRAAALEALDRDTHSCDDIYFVDRMKRAAALAGDPFLNVIGNVDSWAKRFKNARNAAAHQVNGRPPKANHSDFFLAEIAYYLFVLCLLRHVQATDKAFDRIGRNERFQEVAERMNAMPDH